MMMEELREVILDITKVSEEDFHSSTRAREFLAARFPFVALARHYGYTYPEISKFLGYTCHTSSMHGERVMKEATEDGMMDPYSKRLRWVYYSAVRECDRRARALQESCDNINIEPWAIMNARVGGGSFHA